MNKNFDEIKDRLSIRMINFQRTNFEDGKDYVVGTEGDFSFYYVLLSPENTDEIVLTYAMLYEWGISQKILHSAAIESDRNHGVHVTALTYGEDASNLYMLSYENEAYGASLILDIEIRKAIWQHLGRNYFVMPSSVHEVIIAPDYNILESECLFELVRVCNSDRSIVKEDDILSYEVQWCTETGLMINARAKEEFLNIVETVNKLKEKNALMRLYNIKLTDIDRWYARDSEESNVI